MRMHFQLPIIVCFLLLFCMPTKAQKVNVLLSDSGVLNQKTIRKQIKALELGSKNKQGLRLIEKMEDAGYWGTHIDTLAFSDSAIKLFIKVPTRVKWIGLNVDTSTAELLRDMGVKAKPGIATKSVADFSSFRRKCIAALENHGYPFSTFKLEGLINNRNEIEANVVLQKNHLIRYDSLVIKGDARISPLFLGNYLNIETNDTYNEKNIKRIERRLNQLGYLSQVKAPDIVFTKTKAKPLLYINTRRNNQMDGLVGFLPDDVTGKILFTGQAHLKLQNSFSYGELLDINWRKLQARTQDLKVLFNAHHIYTTSLGIESSLKVYNRDTVFQDVTPMLGLQYFFSGLNYIRLFVNYRSSSLNSTRGYENISYLPDYADVTSTLYGLGIKIDELDYPLNPSRGIRVSANIAAGYKMIQQNPRINPEAYKNIELKTAQYTTDVCIDYFIPLYKKHVLYLSNDFFSTQASRITGNELYRIGGLNTLRGFDDESINASSYNVGTMEYRFLFERNSFLYVFSDACWYENNSVNTYLKDTPYSFGAGVCFETKAGIFNINYALGKQFNNPILIRSAKIHFGFSSYF